MGGGGGYGDTEICKVTTNKVTMRPWDWSSLLLLYKTSEWDGLTDKTTKAVVLNHSRRDQIHVRSSLSHALSIGPNFAIPPRHVMTSPHKGNSLDRNFKIYIINVEQQKNNYHNLMVSLIHR